MLMKVITSMEDREWVLSLTVFQPEYKILKYVCCSEPKAAGPNKGNSQYSTELE